MTEVLEVGLYVFVLATFLGFEVIRRVPKLLHTPLMSLTNAISGIALVGSLILAGSERGALATALGTIAVAASAALALLPLALAIPVAIVLAAAAVAAKVFGMGALFLLVGQKLLANVAPARRPAALALGFAVLGGISLLPFAGAVVWSAASVVAVGVAFVSRFGTPRMRVALTQAG